MVGERQFEPYIELETDADNIYIGAYVGGEQIGFLEANFREDQILITNIYVKEEYRRQHVATDILNELVDFLYVEDLHIPLSIDYILEDELKELHTFLMGREDFIVVPNGEEYIIDKDVWNNCFGSKQIENLASTGIKISELLCREKGKVIEELKNKDLYMVPVGKALTDIYDNELSHMAFADGEFKAGLLAREVIDSGGEELIELSAAICKAGCELWMMKLLAGFLSNMRKKYSNHSIRIYGVNEESRNLIHKFFEGKAITKFGYSAIWMGI